MCNCMHAYLCACVHACKSVGIHACLYACISVYMHILVCVYLHVCIPICMCSCMHMYLPACVCGCIYIWVHVALSTGRHTDNCWKCFSHSQQSSLYHGVKVSPQSAQDGRVEAMKSISFPKPSSSAALLPGRKNLRDENPGANQEGTFSGCLNSPTLPGAKCLNP